MKFIIMQLNRWTHLFIYFGSDVQAGKSVEKSNKYTRNPKCYQITKGILWNREISEQFK
jgi:hypothetical protein